jgi:sec-independent protein translocase protein TatA
MVVTILNIRPLFLLSAPGGGEWLWILIAIIVLFGARKIPGLARGIGQGMKEFKDAKDNGKTDTKKEEENEQKKQE